jgi:hypothetical protein
MDTYLISAIDEKNKNTTAARYWLVEEGDDNYNEGERDEGVTV